MLLELSIRDYAIIDTLNLSFGPGFSVLTGETGAGKSIIIDGLNLLLGSRADSTMVRSGARQAQIEGVFDIAHLGNAFAGLLEREQLGGDEADRLVLAREIRSNGRSTSRVNGRAVTLDLLRQVSDGLVDIHGQSEHLSLVAPMGAMYAFPRIGGGPVDDYRFALDLLEHKHVLVAPGVSFNVPYTDHFRITTLPEPERLTEAFARIEELLHAYRVAEA